jgi:hypothetical protein
MFHRITVILHPRCKQCLTDAKFWWVTVYLEYLVESQSQMKRTCPIYCANVKESPHDMTWWRRRRQSAVNDVIRVTGRSPVNCAWRNSSGRTSVTTHLLPKATLIWRPCVIIMVPIWRAENFADESQFCCCQWRRKFATADNPSGKFVGYILGRSSFFSRAFYSISRSEFNILFESSVFWEEILNAERLGLRDYFCIFSLQGFFDNTSFRGQLPPNYNLNRILIYPCISMLKCPFV